MSRLLVIDASSAACSVALLDGNEKTGDYAVAPRQHAKLILPMVENLLVKAELDLKQLDAIACHVGPGTFTGIRVAVSAAQGLAYGANLPAISLSSLANLAIQGWSETGQSFWLCALDARMDEVYFAVFKVDSKGQIEVIRDIIGSEEVIEEQVIKPELIDFNGIITSIQDSQKEDAPSELSEFGLIGNGWQVYKDKFFKDQLFQDSGLFRDNKLSNQQLISDIYPNAYYSLDYAKQKLQEGKVLKAEELQPVYLRNNVAKKRQMREK